MAVFGTKYSSSSRRVLEQGATVVPGVVYESNYTVEGIRTLFPGWENEAINRVVSDLASGGAEVLYADINERTVTIQYRYALRYGEFQASVFPVAIAVYALAAVVITACAYLLSLTLVGGVIELGKAVAESPQTQMLVYAGIAIIFLYLINQRSRSSSKS
jgi:hypothetical protein